MIDIVKLANGNVAIYDSTSGDFINSLSPDIVEIECNVNGSVKVVQDNGSVEYIDPATVANTEVVPAAPIAFTGDCADLAALLSSDFFFVVSGGGGASDLATVLGIGNSAGAFNIDLNNNDLLNTDKIDFNLATTDTAGVGQLVWNNTDGTLDLGLQGGLKNKVGQQLVVKARNTSGSLIAKGSVVKVVGVSGGFIGINLAQADNDANSATAFGIVAEDIADTSNGFVTINGIVHGVNTNAFTEGDILYLSPTTPGEITNVKPVSPAHIVVVGYVAKKSLTDGHILLHVQNGYELDELHNVTINPLTLANNDVLSYESATSLWKNKPFTNAEGWSVIVKSANQDVTNNATLQDDTELQFSVVSGGQYMIEMDAVISASSATGDYKNAFVVSAGTMKGMGILNSYNLSGLIQTVVISASTAAITTTNSIGTISGDIDMLASIKIIYSFTASANGIFKYQFSNASANTTFVSRTFKGSILKYKKIN
jgi:hypothetical protein